MTKLLEHFKEEITTQDAGKARKKFQFFGNFGELKMTPATN